METKPWAIALVVFVTLITTSAQLLYKYGVSGSSIGELLKGGVVSTALTLFMNPWVILGLMLYGVGAVLLVIAFKGGEATVLFPIIATSYLWVVLASYYLYDTSIGWVKLLGVLVLMSGVVLIGTGGSK